LDGAVARDRVGCVVGAQVEGCWSELALGDECGANERVEECDVGPAGGEDRDAVLRLGSGVEVVADEFCSELFGISALVDASVGAVGGDGWVDVPGA
jgi:hypothetical protein